MDLGIAIALSWSDIMFFNVTHVWIHFTYLFLPMVRIFPFWHCLSFSPSQHISGSAYKIVNKRAYHHGTMLISTRLDHLGDVLRPEKVCFFYHLRGPDFFAKPCLSWINMHATRNTGGWSLCHWWLAKITPKIPWTSLFILPEVIFLLTYTYVSVFDRRTWSLKEFRLFAPPYAT